VYRLSDHLKVGDDFYPVVLVEWRDRLYLVDGRLRIEAYRRRGIKEIPAIVIHGEVGI